MTRTNHALALQLVRATAISTQAHKAVDRHSALQIRVKFLRVAKAAKGRG